VRLDNDVDPEDPHDWSDWVLRSFSRRHRNFVAPTTQLLHDLKDRLQRRLAFTVSYYEHGPCTWSLRGSGPQCQWDTVQNAGVVEWIGPASGLPRTYKAREQSVKTFLETYTSYCNGEVYAFSVEDEYGDVVDSCGGFYSPSDLVRQVKVVVGDKHFAVQGQAAFLWPDGRS
jgi:hypothetical protein